MFGTVVGAMRTSPRFERACHLYRETLENVPRKLVRVLKRVAIKWLVSGSLEEVSASVGSKRWQIAENVAESIEGSGRARAFEVASRQVV
ncbi:hypothetical protein MES5069_450001 [Mesorhizobium escarrei]|uniref:Uncharacterized protein n=1 Tax=Mesorhizobium escarrei TaxID=666018 RepID=A0ABM9E771_9HYPH|nr:hypothetical protein MES5069_450001 [Mesorhizobium escarrei]